ncbi:putative bacterioferritin subunit 2 [uncultured Gammaproteobacteria bacterium]
MKGDVKIIRHLNVIITNQLTAVHQYFLHSRMLQHWGLPRLAEKMLCQSNKQLCQCEQVVDRILFLEGVSNMQDVHKLKIGEDVPEIFTCNLSTESVHRTCLVEAIADCEAARDYQTREILMEILTESEKRIDWQEGQISLIQRVSLAAYLQEHMSVRED